MTSYFDFKNNPLRAGASLGALLIALLVFPSIASNYGNSWVRIVDLALLYVMLARFRSRRRPDHAPEPPSAQETPT